MKKLFTFLSIALILAACDKETSGNDNPSGGNSSSGGNGPKEIESISLPSTTLLISVEAAGGKLLPVTLAPEGCTSAMLDVVLSEEGIVSWSAADGGILFKPLKIGQVEATIKAKTGPATSKKATVKVLSAGDYASVEISKIEMDTEVYLREGDSEGKTLSVRLTPSEATSDMLKCSGGEEFVTVSAVDGGLKFVPKKVGSTNVKVEARRGSAAAKTVNVVILSKDAYSDYVISEIKYSPSKVELKDNGTLDVTLELTPSGATVADITVSSKDGAIADVEKGSGKVIKIVGKGPGSTKITVKGLREGSTGIEIPVTVYGHVTGISSVSGKDEMMVGEEYTFQANLSTTGTLMSGDGQVTWSSNSSRVTVDASTGKVKAVTANGSTVAATITATFGSFTKTQNVLVWSYPTSVTPTVTGSYELEESKYNLKKGSQSMTVSWKIEPATAKQELSSVTMQYASGTNQGKTPGPGTVSAANSLKGTLQTLLTSGSSANIYDINLVAVPVNVKSGSTVQGNISFYVNEFNSADVKVGDYVYYQSGNFNWSDGGVRTMYPALRKITKATTSLGTLIGQVYSTEVPSDPAFNALTNKKGFSNKGGQHARVISVKLANNGSSTKWSDDCDDVESSSNWTGGPYPTTAEGREFSTKLNTIYYNGKRGDSHDIKPGLLLYDGNSCFDVTTFGALQTTTSGSKSHTGWMLPTTGSAKEFYLSGRFSDVFTKLENKTFSFWLGVQSGSDNALVFSPENSSFTDRKTYLHYVRPILWL